MSLMPVSFCYGDIFGVPTILGLENTDQIPANFSHFISRAKWSQNLKKTVVEYTMFVKPEHKDKIKHPFLFYRLCSKPDEFWLYGVTKPIDPSSRKWEKYKTDRSPLPYAAYSELATSDVSLRPGETESSFFMTTGNPIDVSALAGKDSTDCGELFAGYGLGEKPKDAFDEMMAQKRFELVFSTRFGIEALGSYKLEVKSIGYSNYVRPFPGFLCSSTSYSFLDIGCPNWKPPQ